MKTIENIAGHKILLSLGTGEMTLTQICVKTRLSKQTVHNYVEMLMMLGLVYERREKGIPPKRFIWLSKKGKECAQILHSIAVRHLSWEENRRSTIKKIFNLVSTPSY